MKYYSKASTSLLSVVLIACVFFILINFRSPYPFLLRTSFVVGGGLVFFSLIDILNSKAINRSLIKSILIFIPFFLYGFFITPFSIDIKNHSQILLTTLFFYVCCFSVLSFFLKKIYTLEKIAPILLYGWLVVSSVFFVANFLGYYSFPKEDFSGSLHDRNVYSIMTVLLLIFYLSVLDKLRLAGLIALVFASFFVLYSKSITGLLGLGIVALLISRSQLVNVKIKVVWVVLVLSLLYLLFSTDNPLSARIDKFLLAARGDSYVLYDNSSAYVRHFLFFIGLEVTMNNPIFGVGLDSVRFLFTWPGRDTGSFLHNTYLDISTSGGIPLLVFFMLPLIWSFGNLLKSKEFCMKRCGLRKLWNSAFYILLFQCIYQCTWTAYYEFGMLIFYLYAVVISFYLKKAVKFEKNTLYR